MSRTSPLLPSAPVSCWEGLPGASARSQQEGECGQLTCPPESLATSHWAVTVLQGSWALGSWVTCCGPLHPNLPRIRFSLFTVLPKVAKNSESGSPAPPILEETQGLLPASLVTTFFGQRVHAEPGFCVKIPLKIYPLDSWTLNSWPSALQTMLIWPSFSLSGTHSHPVLGALEMSSCYAWGRFSTAKLSTKAQKYLQRVTEETVKRTPLEIGELKQEGQVSPCPPSAGKVHVSDNCSATLPGTNCHSPKSTDFRVTHTFEQGRKFFSVDQEQWL